MPGKRGKKPPRSWSIFPDLYDQVADKLEEYQLEEYQLDYTFFEKDKVISTIKSFNIDLYDQVADKLEEYQLEEYQLEEYQLEEYQLEEHQLEEHQLDYTFFEEDQLEEHQLDYTFFEEYQLDYTFFEKDQLEEYQLNYTFFEKDEVIGTIKSFDTNIIGSFVYHNNKCTSHGWSSGVVATTIREFLPLQEALLREQEITGP